eukprot:gene17260-23579_t
MEGEEPPVVVESMEGEEPPVVVESMEGEEPLVVEQDDEQDDETDERRGGIARLVSISFLIKLSILVLLAAYVWMLEEDVKELIVSQYLASKRIQKAWRRAALDPEYAACRNTLMREFDMMT